MAASFVLGWPAGWDLPAVLDHLSEYLRKQGFEVNRERVGWRVMMFRRDQSQWTQVYHGLTKRAKAPRSRVSIAGPEKDALLPVRHGFYAGGLFAGDAEEDDRSVAEMLADARIAHAMGEPVPADLAAMFPEEFE